MSVLKILKLLDAIDVAFIISLIYTTVVCIKVNKGVKK